MIGGAGGEKVKRAARSEIRREETAGGSRVSGNAGQVQKPLK